MEKRITVLVDAHYDFNDLCWLNEKMIDDFRNRGIDVITGNHGDVEKRLKNQEKINVLAIDYHTVIHTGIVELCRKLHPETKLALFDCCHFSDQEKNEYDVFYYTDELSEPHPVHAILTALRELGFIDKPKRYWDE
jgi:hypothetical protein